MPDGILLADKPAGETSAGIVRILKRRHRLRKIGHLGTLDPMATGVLPLCIDGGTKIAQFLDAADKAYCGEILLGLATDTLDITGQETARGPVPEFDAARLAQLAAELHGERLQTPPMYSAVKIGGQELYKLARAGIEVERKARLIRIDQITLRPGSTTDRVRFSVDCSKGTYIRVLAEEIGAALGCPATLASLRRTRFGPFGEAESHTMEALEACAVGALPVLTPTEALRTIPSQKVSAELAYALAVGRKGSLRDFAGPTDSPRVALIAPDNALLAIADRDGEGWVLRRMLYPQASELYRPESRC
ncbi:MAG: tRNA pseudouridine(55) synthase TruB [Deltaproteobacteria bacterium]